VVTIPAGKFVMGSAGTEDGHYENEGPQRDVTIGAFELGATPVTRAQFADFVADTRTVISAGCSAWNGSGWKEDKDASWEKPGFKQSPDHPVVCVSWDDARAYVTWLSSKTGKKYRLPTEAEYEYAARAGTTTSRYWGDDPNLACGYANGADRTARAQVPGGDRWTIAECEDGYAYTAPAHFGEANGFLLYGMLGNVWEWTQDCWHGSYEGAPTDGSAWLRANGGDCGRQVVRGGGWGNFPRNVRSASRYKNVTSERANSVGFRVARTRS
jgi:formylglycine-generating enzyme required for sulfatase activity